MAKTKSKTTSKKSQSKHTTQQSQTLGKKTEPDGSGTCFSHPEKHGAGTATPFTFMRRFSEEMDRLFEDFGLGRGLLAPTFESGLDKLTAMAASKWSPQVEVFEQDNQLVIRADLPGMTKDNVNIDIANDAVVIRGERKSEREENESGYYRSERSYGSFYRRIPLPEGVSAENATADFRNGVLEIKIPAAQRVEQKRRQLEIRGETASEEQPRSRAKAAGQG